MILRSLLKKKKNNTRISAYSGINDIPTVPHPAMRCSCTFILGNVAGTMEYQVLISVTFSISHRISRVLSKKHMPCSIIFGEYDDMSLLIWVIRKRLRSISDFQMILSKISRLWKHFFDRVLIFNPMTKCAYTIPEMHLFRSNYSRFLIFLRKICISLRSNHEPFCRKTPSRHPRRIT